MGSRKGIPNKITTSAKQLSEKLGIDPLQILLLIAGEKWSELGYDSRMVTRYTAEGKEYEIERITTELRTQAAGKAVQYIYPTQKAVEVTGEDGAGFKVIIEDFTSGK